MQKEPTILQKTLAWGVHLFTACGLLAGFMAILAINQSDWRSAMIWLMVCLLVDGIDGTFARMFRVREVLPKVDGKTIDYVIDFATYAIIPAYFFYQAQLVPEAWRLICTFCILLVSALYYGKEGMVSEDMHFVGFPVLWNMVVFYQVFIFQISEMGHVAIVFIFAILHFVPLKFAYPSQMSRHRILTIVLTVLLIVDLLAILYIYPERNFWLSKLAVITAWAFGIMAIYDTWFEK
ncbi:MAG: phosphatidylcholine synthase [Bacteroidota bacterium]